MGTSAAQGAIVTNITPGSPAHRAGIREGDIITRIGNEKVKNAQSAAAALSKNDLSKGVRLYVTSKDGDRFVFVKTGASR